MKRVVIVYIGAGGGHRVAAHALRDAIHREKRPWHVELVNTDDVLRWIDPAFWIARRRWSDVYNWTQRHGWTYGSGLILRFGHAGYFGVHSAHVALLRRVWRERRPDLVVSVVPHLNRALYRSLKKETPETPLVTILTDLADYPPHFWIEPQPQHFVCGTKKSAEQAAAIAGDLATVWPVSGMLLHPGFCGCASQSASGGRASERRALGLDPARPTGLVLFGSSGSGKMLEIARMVAEANLGIQLVFLCGHHASLARKLRALDLPYPVHVQEFTADVPRFMRLSDFFIGKPGPGCLSEALAMKLPVIVTSGPEVMVHERYNV